MAWGTVLTLPQRPEPPAQGTVAYGGKHAAILPTSAGIYMRETAAQVEAATCPGPLSEGA